MRSRYERHENTNFRCFHDATTSSLRFYKDPATIIPRSHRAYSATSLRLYRSFYALHVLTTTIPRVIWLQHDLTAIIARSYHDCTTFIPRSYYVLSNTVNIVFPINIVPFLLFLIKTKSTRTRGRGGRGWCRGRGSSDSNESWSSSYVGPTNPT